MELKRNETERRNYTCGRFLCWFVYMCMWLSLSVYVSLRICLSVSFLPHWEWLLQGIKRRKEGRDGRHLLSVSAVVVVSLYLHLLVCLTASVLLFLPSSLYLSCPGAYRCFPTLAVSRLSVFVLSPTLCLSLSVSLCLSIFHSLLLLLALTCSVVLRTQYSVPLCAI